MVLESSPHCSLLAFADVQSAKEQAFLEELGATKIQALVRGRQSRLLTEATRIGLLTATETIQAAYRAHLSRSRHSTSVGVHSVAARTIQHAIRTYLHRQRNVHSAAISEELSDVQHIAATSLQRFWRQVVARRDVLLEQLEAATCIQALGRGHLARKSVQSLRASASQLHSLSTEVRLEYSLRAKSALDSASYSTLSRLTLVGCSRSLALSTAVGVLAHACCSAGKRRRP